MSKVSLLSFGASVKHTPRVQVLAVAFTLLAVSNFTLTVNGHLDAPKAEAVSLSDFSADHSAAPVNSVSDATTQRAELLTRSVIVSFDSSSGSTVATWPVVLKDFPGWVVFEADGMGGTIATISKERITQYLIGYPIQGLGESKSCNVFAAAPDAQGVLRAETDCIGKVGYSYDRAALLNDVVDALKNGKDRLVVSVASEEPTVKLVGYGSGETLTLLSTGESTFTGSGEGRKNNVRKALSQHLNNVIVPTGAEFSFNKVLGKSVGIGSGWSMALTIFDGGTLRPAPGGGICQASTTMYRAALKAGFPIVAQKSHSLYVTYYEAYGVGQDATIFMGAQDFKFKNDTPGPLVIQSYYEGDHAYVRVYGIDDGRRVTLAGPYFAKNNPEFMTDGVAKKIKLNEIAWTRTVVSATGEQKDNTFVSRYKQLPKSLAAKWPLTVTQTRGAVMTALAQ